MTLTVTLSFDDEFSQKLRTGGIDVLDTGAIRKYIFSLIHNDLDGAKNGNH